MIFPIFSFITLICVAYMFYLLHYQCNKNKTPIKLEKNIVNLINKKHIRRPVKISNDNNVDYM